MKNNIEKMKRITLVFNAYSINKPIDIIKQIVLGLEDLCKTLITKANEGDEAFIRMINTGVSCAGFNRQGFVEKERGMCI